MTPVARNMAVVPVRGTVVCISPLLPITAPSQFFTDTHYAADVVIIDHFRCGDGSHYGARTLQTPLPAAMEAASLGSTALAYREEIIDIARDIMPNRLGVSRSGFAGVFS